jgi:hypothetical protein
VKSDTPYPSRLWRDVPDGKGLSGVMRRQVPLAEGFIYRVLCINDLRADRGFGLQDFR